MQNHPQQIKEQSNCETNHRWNQNAILSYTFSVAGKLLHKYSHHFSSVLMSSLHFKKFNKYTTVQPWELVSCGSSGFQWKLFLLCRISLKPSKSQVLRGEKTIWVRVLLLYKNLASWHVILATPVSQEAI